MISINKVQELILKLIILMTPLFSFYEVYSLFRGRFYSLSALSTPIGIKIIKDIGIIIIVLLSMIRLIKNIDMINFKLKDNLWVILILISFIFTLIQDGFTIGILSGIRWSLPIFFYLLADNLSKREILNDINLILKKLFILHIVVQFFQMFLIKNNYWGVNFLDLNLRNPGIFISPSSGAIFTISVLLFYLIFDKNKKKSYLIFFLFSVILTSSGIGILLIAFIYVVNAFLGKKITNPLLPIIIILLSFLFIINLDIISGRSNIIVSLLIRIEIFLNSILDSGLLFSLKFGDATNTNILIRNTYSINTDGIIVDSLITSLIINIGLLGTILFFVSIIKYFNFKNYYSVLIIGTFILISITIIILEAFPMNLLFFLLLNYIIKNKFERDY